MASVVFSMFDMLNGNLDTSTWSLPFDTYAPFDMSIIWKWYSLWFIQFNIGFVYVSAIASITSYFACCCLYMGAICGHFEHLFESIADAVQRFPTQNNLMQRRKESFIKGRNHEIREIFCKIVDIEATVFR